MRALMRRNRQLLIAAAAMVSVLLAGHASWPKP